MATSSSMRHTSVQRTTKFGLSALRRCVGVGLAPLLALGCVTATPLSGPHGELRYYIECSGLGAPLTVCLDRAEEVCRLGYRLLRVRTAGPGDAPGRVWSEEGGLEVAGEGSDGEKGAPQSILVECTSERLP